MVRKIIIMPDYLFYTAASSRMRLRSSHHPDHSAAAAEKLLSLVSSLTLFNIFDTNIRADVSYFQKSVTESIISQQTFNTYAYTYTRV